MCIPERKKRSNSFRIRQHKYYKESSSHTTLAEEIAVRENCIMQFWCTYMGSLWSDKYKCHPDIFFLFIKKDSMNTKCIMLMNKEFLW